MPLYDQKNQSNYSNIASTNDLIEIILKKLNFDKDIKIKKNCLPENFKKIIWKDELEDQNFSPVFQGIDFEIINNYLLEIMVYGPFIKLITAMDFSHCELNSCKSINVNNLSYCIIREKYGGKGDKQISDNIFKNCNFKNITFKDFYFIQSSFESCLFEQVTFENCNFEKINIKKCQFIKSRIYSSSFKESEIENCIFNSCTIVNLKFFKLNYANNYFNSETFVRNTPWDEECCKSFELPVENKPNVIVSYNPDDLNSTINCDLFISFMKSKNINVIRISPEIGMKHPIFQLSSDIHGIVLPGGPDLLRNGSDMRTACEIAMLEFANKNDKIPVLGICRGMQLVARYYGATIEEMKNRHFARTSRIIVEAIEGSVLYNRLNKKHKKFENLNSSEKALLSKTSSNEISYVTSCAHNQFAFFEEENHDKTRVMITAKADDGTIEAMQIDQHIFVYAHHNEAKQNKVTNCIMNDYLNIVKKQHEKAINIDLCSAIFH